MKDEIKSIKTDISYIKSSVEGWSKFGEAYNYEMVMKMMDSLREKIMNLKNNHFPTEDKTSE